MINNIKVLIRGGQSKPLSSKFFCIINARKNEKQVTPISNKKIIHLGTMFIFFNRLKLFDGDM
jgi:hypothetical protein